MITMLDYLNEQLMKWGPVDPKGRKISNAYTGWQSVDGCDNHPAFQKLMRCIKQTFYDEVCHIGV